MYGFSGVCEDGLSFPSPLSLDSTHNLVFKPCACLDIPPFPLNSANSRYSLLAILRYSLLTISHFHFGQSQTKGKPQKNSVLQPEKFKFKKERNFPGKNREVSFLFKPLLYRTPITLNNTFSNTKV